MAAQAAESASAEMRKLVLLTKQLALSMPRARGFKVHLDGTISVFPVQTVRRNAAAVHTSSRSTAD